jgi:hypothetical protein
VAQPATTGITMAAPAVADDDYSFDFHRPRIVLQPGEGWAELGPGSVTGSPDGTLVYAVSKKPLTDPAWTGGGAPAGLTVSTYDDCDKAAGVAGVYLCPTSDDSMFPTPTVEASQSAAADTTMHYGVVYAPRGADIGEAIEAAQTAGSRPADGTHAARTATVRTAAQVARNTMKLTTPDLPAGGTATHTVNVHAVDAARLALSVESPEGQRQWDEDELEVDVVSVNGAGARCDHVTGTLSESGGEYLWCEVAPGDTTVTYTLKAAADVAAWRVRTNAVYEVYDFGTGNPETSSTFAVQSSRPVPERHALFARDKKGVLWEYKGTGKAAAPYAERESVEDGWQRYSAMTKLSALTAHNTGAGIVARDTSGVLWYHAMSGDYSALKPKARVGSGWNVYNSITGLGDVTGDGRADLMARDTSGVFWLYEGSGGKTDPFKPRVRIGSGWNVYTQTTGVGEFTGDGKADLLAVDRYGKLWLYAGTGRAAAPFAPRVQVGTGWNIYNIVNGAGDLDQDGRPDLVARDGAGQLWLYNGTGNAAAPYKPRTLIGKGWSTYNNLI